MDQGDPAQGEPWLPHCEPVAPAHVSEIGQEFHGKGEKSVTGEIYVLEQEQRRAV
jgi:hypothetical protein